MESEEIWKARESLPEQGTLEPRIKGGEAASSG